MCNDIEPLNFEEGVEASLITLSNFGKGRFYVYGVAKDVARKQSYAIIKIVCFAGAMFLFYKYCCCCYSFV